MSDSVKSTECVGFFYTGSLFLH